MHSLFCLLITGLIATPVSSQTSASVVKIKPALSVDRVKQGGSFQIAIVLEIDRAYHINSNRPSEAFLIGTSLKLETLPGLTTALVRYPRPVVKKFAFAKKPLSVYEGRVIIVASARASPQMAVGKQTLNGKLRVQACSDEVCLQPKTVDVQIPLEVVPASAEVRSINTDLFGPGARRKGA